MTTLLTTYHESGYYEIKADGRLFLIDQFAPDEWQLTEWKGHNCVHYSEHTSKEAAFAHLVELTTV